MVSLFSTQIHTHTHTLFTLFTTQAEHGMWSFSGLDLFLLIFCFVYFLCKFNHSCIELKLVVFYMMKKSGKNMYNIRQKRLAPYSGGGLS